jgi:hypothetical protein
MERGRAQARQARLARRGIAVVPDLVGLTAPEAGRLGMRAGLRVTGPDGDPGALGRLGGRVVGQRPEAHARVGRDADIVVWTDGADGGGH